MDVHLRDLRYFVAVAEELHFTHAAERLRVSQPALSRQIRALERRLDVALFTRGHRVVSLTTAGEGLLGAARELLAAWDEALQQARRRDRAAAAVLRVGFHTSVAGHLYRDAAAGFLAANPGWRVALRLHPWSDTSAGLADGSSDVAFLWLPIPEQELLSCRILRTEHRAVALWSAHPLAARSELSMRDLLDEPFVALPPEAGVLRDYWLALDRRGGHPVRIGTQAESPDATFEAVVAEQGVVLLAEGNAELYARPGIVARRVVDLDPCELAIAWRADDDRSVVVAFAEAALEAQPGLRQDS